MWLFKTGILLETKYIESNIDKTDEDFEVTPGKSATSIGWTKRDKINWRGEILLDLQFSAG